MVLNAEAYENVKLTQAEAKKLKQRLQFLRHGASAQVAVVCAGTRCPYKISCPYWEAEEAASQLPKEQAERIPKLPIGKPCPIEHTILLMQAEKYATGFGLKDDAGDYIDRQLCLRLAELDVLEYRLNILQSSALESTMIEEEPVAVDPRTKETLTRRSISRFIELKFNVISRQRDRLLDLMTGTRKSKWQKAAALKETLGADPSRRMADVRIKIDKIRNDQRPDKDGGVQSSEEGSLGSDPSGS